MFFETLHHQQVKKIYWLQALITLVGPTQFLVMYYWLTTGFSLYPSFTLNIHCFVLVKEKGMQFQCLSLAPLRSHVLRCLSNDINKLLWLLLK